MKPDRAALHCLELGAAGYLDSRDPPIELVAKIRAATIGETLVSRHFAAALIARLIKFKRLATDINGYHNVKSQDQVLTLTVREQEVNPSSVKHRVVKYSRK